MMKDELLIDYLIIGEKLEIVSENENGDIGNEIEIISNNIQRAFYVIHAGGIFKKIGNYMGLSYKAYQAMGRAVPSLGWAELSRAAILRPFTLGASWPMHVMISSPPN